jgi:hypothetical protein
MSFPLSLPNLAHAIWQIFMPTIQAVMGHAERRGVPEAMRVLAHRRMALVSSRLRHLIAKAVAGTLPKPRAKRPPVDRPEGWTPRPRAKCPWPRAFAWVTKLAGNGCAIIGANGLAWLVENDAEMKLLLQAAPQSARLMRSFFWMTGATLPVALRLPHAMRPIPADYVPGNERYRRRNPCLGFSVYENLAMNGWRAFGHYPKRKPRKPSPAKQAERAQRGERKRMWAEMRAEQKARLREPQRKITRPMPRSRPLSL